MRQMVIFAFLFSLFSCNSHEKLNENVIKDVKQIYNYKGNLFCVFFNKNEGLYFLKKYDTSKLLVAESRIKNSMVIPVIDTIYNKKIIIRYDDIASETDPDLKEKIQFDTLKTHPEQWPEYFIYNGDYEIIYMYTNRESKQFRF